MRTERERDRVRRFVFRVLSRERFVFRRAERDGEELARSENERLKSEKQRMQQEIESLKSQLAEEQAKNLALTKLNKST